MSNVLTAIGRGQLRVLADRVRRKREIFKFYADTIGDLPGISLMPEAPRGRATHWLTVITPPRPPILGGGDSPGVGG